MLRILSAALILSLLAIGCAGEGEQEGEQSYAGEMAEQHEADQPDPTTLIKEPIIPVRAQPVQYADANGEPVVGYLAMPQRPDSVAEAMGMAPGDTALPAIIVIHEWWGLNDNIEAMTRRLAGEGYRALAVDLYQGQVAEDPQAAQGLMQLALDDEAQAVANLEAAYAFLESNYSPREIGVVGWCFGGAMALNAALAMPEQLGAAAIYYGRVGDAERDELAALDMPILGIFGAEDQSISVESVRQFESTLQELDKDVTIHVYENAGHAFANPSGQNFVAPAAEDAWDKTTAFLKRHLYDGASPSM